MAIDTSGNPGNKQIKPGSICILRGVPKEWEQQHLGAANGCFVTAVKFYGTNVIINANTGGATLFSDVWGIESRHFPCHKESNMSAPAKWLIPINDPDQKPEEAEYTAKVIELNGLRVAVLSKVS